MKESRLYRLFPVSLALLSLIAFLPALRNDFVDWDDGINFLENTHFRGLGWEQLRWMWTSHLLYRYIPVTWMTLGLDYNIWGLDPFGFHLTSLLWHTANAVIFYWLAITLLRWAIPEGSQELRGLIPFGAFFAALIFSVHPLRVESVAWVTERRDLVSGFFYLLAVLVYLRGVREPAARGIERRHYWGCFALFILGCLSKEMVVTLPVILLILDIYPLRRLGGGPGRWFGAEARRVWLEKIPFFALSAADSALALYVGFEEEHGALMSHMSPISRAAVSVYGLAFYVWKTVWPFHLSPLHAMSPQRIDPRGLPVQLSAVVVIWMIAAALLLRRRFPALPAAVAAYGVTLFPVLGIFHNGYQITADRYSYLACLGWALLAGVVLLLIWKSGGNTGKALGATAAALITGALMFLTWQQVEVWRDSETLWSYCIATDPSSVAYNNFGGMMAQRGDVLGATDYLRQAVELDPGNGQARNNYGNALMNLQEWEGAAREFQAAQEIMPRLENAYWGLGCVRLAQGRFDEAIHQFQEALRLDPSDSKAREKLDEAMRGRDSRSPGDAK